MIPKWTKTLNDMQRASALCDEMIGPGTYQTRMIALAMIARQFLREFDNQSALLASVTPQDEPALLVSVATQENKEKALGGVSPTAVDAVPSLVPTDSATARREDYDKPLDVTIEADALVIRIGVGVLAHAVTYSDWANPFKPDEGEYLRDFAITDAPQFAKDVASAMQDEREDGSSPLSDFIDAASEEAINQGSLGLDENFNHKIKHGEKSPLETW